MYDVIVVGAGPAGSTAARQLAKRNVKVLLLDKAVFPRTKPCAGGVVNKSIQALDFNIEEVVDQYFYGVRMISSGAMVETIQEEALGALVMREKFDKLLVDKAVEAGAEFREGARVKKVMQLRDSVLVLLDDSEEFRAKYIVGADGINSVVAKQLGFYDGWKNDTAALCIEAEVEASDEVIDAFCGVDGKLVVNIYFNVVEYGYAWIFPKKGCLSIGIGCLQSKSKHLYGIFNKWINSLGDFHFTGYSSARISNSGPVKETVIGRAALVGDAAGFANPHSGEGISKAIISGKLVAHAVANAINFNDIGYFEEYETLWKNEFYSDFEVARQFVDLIFKYENGIDAVLRLGKKDDEIVRLLGEFFMDNKPLKEIRNSLIKRILMKHLGKMLKYVVKRGK